MPYLLDTNIVIAILEDPGSSVGQRAKWERLDDLCVSSIVTHELFFGAFKSRHQRHNLDRLDRMHFPVLDFDRDDARQAGLIRAELSARGVPIGPYDVLIAGQAVARDLILVTGNTREFSRVPGLRIADWEA